MSLKNLLLALLTVFAVAGGCASPNFVYLPAHGERGKATYVIPTNHPDGNVRAMSGGVVKLKPDVAKGGKGEEFKALHLRLVVSNQSDDKPWVVDSAAQTVSFPNTGSGSVVPVFVQSDTGAPINGPVSIARGEMKTFDLYYRLPEIRKDEEAIPEFDFRWKVQAGDHVAQETTSFDRVELRYYGYAPGDPFYAPYGTYMSPYGPWGYGSYGYPGWYAPPPVVVSPPAAAGSKPVIVH